MKTYLEITLIDLTKSATRKLVEFGTSLDNSQIQKCGIPMKYKCLLQDRPERDKSELLLIEEDN